MLNNPKDHHYLPQFLLRAWAGCDGKIERFTQPRPGKLDVRRVYPSEAGFQRNLYAAPPGVNPSFDAERDFFQKLDSAAALAHAKLLRLEKPDAQDRYSWAAFVLSLFHRTPEHLKATTALLDAMWDRVDDSQGRYEAIRQAGDPLTIQEYLLRLDPNIRARSSFASLLRSIESSPLVNFLSRITWGVIDVSAAARSLLLSDNPVMLAPLAKPLGHIAMPIGPTRLFVATVDLETGKSIRRLGDNQLTRNSNAAVVQHATATVIADNRRQAPYIARHFGTKPIGSLATGFK